MTPTTPTPGREPQQPGEREALARALMVTLGCQVQADDADCIHADDSMPCRCDTRYAWCAVHDWEEPQPPGATICSYAARLADAALAHLAERRARRTSGSTSSATSRRCAMLERTPMDLDTIREEWGYADEAGQREWALEHADDLMAEVERLQRDLATMDHFAEVAERVERVNNNLHARANEAHDRLVAEAAEMGWATDGRLATGVGHAVEMIRRLRARAEAAEAKVRAGRIVAEHWRDALMATAREHPANALGTHPVAMVLAALDGEIDPTAVGIDPSHPDAARLAALADPTPEATA